MSINVRGAANAEKRRAIFNKHRIHSDILILHETHSTPEMEHIWESEWGGKVIYAHGTNTARGVAAFMSKALYEQISNIHRDILGRLLIFDLKYDQQVVTIAAVYAPNEDRPDYFQQMAEVLRSRQEHKIVIGDFNLVLDVEKDRENTYSHNNKAKDKLLDIMDKFCMKDTWRVQNEDKREFSWIKNTNTQSKPAELTLHSSQED